MALQFSYRTFVRNNDKLTKNHSFFMLNEIDRVFLPYFRFINYIYIKIK
jgi:hypothetical protein